MGVYTTHAHTEEHAPSASSFGIAGCSHGFFTLPFPFIDPLTDGMMNKAEFRRVSLFANYFDNCLLREVKNPHHQVHVV
jgi:hypothetical protein